MFRFDVRCALVALLCVCFLMSLSARASDPAASWAWSGAPAPKPTVAPAPKDRAAEPVATPREGETKTAAPCPCGKPGACACAADECPDGCPLEAVQFRRQAPASNCPNGKCTLTPAPAQTSEPLGATCAGGVCVQPQGHIVPASATVPSAGTPSAGAPSSGPVFADRPHLFDGRILQRIKDRPRLFGGRRGCGSCG